MKVSTLDLFIWSFFMATAHRAGLMVAPAMLEVANPHHTPEMHLPSSGIGLFLTVGAHTIAMLIVMGFVAWIVYKKFGLAVLRQNWINFDFALLIVGEVALFMAI
ncbi:MAG: hypothetical protein E3K32_13290 [wastewater metagenome]|nr:hypothetical protein [Candidatus Loosdrechtia aerotolerans]